MAITIKHDGDTWKILSEGATKDGKTYCHLASTTRGKQQKNGWLPVQIADWIDHAAILSAAIQEEERQRAITEYYEDRAKSGQSPLHARP